MAKHSESTKPSRGWKAAVILAWLYGALVVEQLVQVLLIQRHHHSLEAVPLVILGVPWPFLLPLTAVPETPSGGILLLGAFCALNLCLYVAFIRWVHGRATRRASQIADMAADPTSHPSSLPANSPSPRTSVSRWSRP